MDFSKKNGALSEKLQSLAAAAVFVADPNVKLYILEQLGEIVVDLVTDLKLSESSPHEIPRPYQPSPEWDGRI